MYTIPQFNGATFTQFTHDHLYYGQEKERKINSGLMTDTNLRPLAFSCSRVPLLHNKFYCLPAGFQSNLSYINLND